MGHTHTALNEFLFSFRGASPKPNVSSAKSLIIYRKVAVEATCRKITDYVAGKVDDLFTLPGASSTYTRTLGHFLKAYA